MSAAKRLIPVALVATCALLVLTFIMRSGSESEPEQAADSSSVRIPPPGKEYSAPRAIPDAEGIRVAENPKEHDHDGDARPKEGTVEELKPQSTEADVDLPDDIDSLREEVKRLEEEEKQKDEARVTLRDHYNDLKIARGDYSPASEEPPPTFVRMTITNRSLPDGRRVYVFIRENEFDDYDQALRDWETSREQLGRARAKLASIEEEQ